MHRNVYSYILIYTIVLNVYHINVPYYHDICSENVFIFLQVYYISGAKCIYRCWSYFGLQYGLLLFPNVQNCTQIAINRDFDWMGGPWKVMKSTPAGSFLTSMGLLTLLSHTHIWDANSFLQWTELVWICITICSTLHTAIPTTTAAVQIITDHLKRGKMVSQHEEDDCSSYLTAIWNFI